MPGDVPNCGVALKEIREEIMRSLKKLEKEATEELQLAITLFICDHLVT